MTTNQQLPLLVFCDQILNTRSCRATPDTNVTREPRAIDAKKPPVPTGGFVLFLPSYPYIDSRLKLRRNGDEVVACRKHIKELNAAAAEAVEDLGLAVEGIVDL